MTSLLGERGDAAVARETPHLSHSRVSRYLTCPEQYRLYYVDNWRPRLAAANLVFGQVVHEALAFHFREARDPVEFFRERWSEAQTIELDYGRDSWEKLRDTGSALLGKFIRDESPHITQVEAVERPFSLDITSLDLPFVGVIDLIADYDDQRTIIDFKTSATKYPAHEVVLSDQLTGYRLAEPDISSVALCVLVKTKEPAIQWHRATRDAPALVEFLTKVRIVGQDIANGRFYKRPGRWCSWCDFLPICLGDEKQARESLVQLK